MEPLRPTTVAIAAITLMLTAGCASTPSQPGPPSEPATDSPSGAAGMHDDLEDLADITTATFSDPTTIDNEWFPLTPGTRLILEGTTREGEDEIPHRVVHNVTDLVKVINGYPALVVWDQDFSDGELQEAELAFFAQDDEGNVWRIGEYPEEYDGGQLADAPSWLHGYDGALAGLAMKADPQPGTPSYAQGWGPEVDWTDRGQVDASGVRACVVHGCYEDVLVIAEWALDEPEGSQLKSYARGIGNISVSWRGDDETQEELELVDLVVLDEAGLTEVRQAALDLETSAYEFLPELYGQTEPMAQLGAR